MSYDHITTSGGLLTNQFIEAIKQPTFNHPALLPETFRLVGRKSQSNVELERVIASAWELLKERWDSVESELARMDISTLRSRWILPLFNLLDLEMEFQRADLVVEEDLRFPISHLARPVGEGERELFIPVHNVLPLEDGLDARRDGGVGIKRLSPHDLLQRYLNLAKDARWGLLCDGIHLRLLRDYHHTYSRGYVEFDLQGIFTNRDLASFRALYRLCHASRFLPMVVASPPAAGRKKTKRDEEEDESTQEEQLAAVPSTPLESLYQQALSTGVKVGDDLRKSVRMAIETLANGFLAATPGWLEKLQAQSDGTRQLYDEILHIIYRILFLMFAEQRGMLPGRGSLYMDEFSLTALRSRAELPPVEDSNRDLWERLKVTFRMVEKGVSDLGVFGYDGVLFGQAHMPLLTPSDEQAAPHLHNKELLSAMRALSTVEKDGVLQRISYLDLSVEEIGSVYESLLDYTPQIAAFDMDVEERPVRPGQFFLDPRGKERKTTGSYYTHPSLVNELIRTALLPVVEERLQEAVPGWDAEHPERLTLAQRATAAAALLAIKVVDPACGSGAFLIAADNALGLQLAKIQAGDAYPTESGVRAARREVLTNCIYGVDLNPMAVELCKVSLWINAAVPDQKLNFLDHHIKCGNSLVGATRALVSQGVPDEAYDPVSGDDRNLAAAFKAQNRRERQGQLSVLRVTEINSPSDFRLWLELTRLAQDDPAEAELRYMELHTQSEESAERLAFDLWTAAFFWKHQVEVGQSDQQRSRAGIQVRKTANLQPPAPTTQDVYQALATPKLVNPDIMTYARQLAEGNRFFHWELEFPEVFSQENQGFDVVLGNPPWERIKLQEKEFFQVYNQEIISTSLSAANRRQAMNNLKETNPKLWTLYILALQRSESISKFIHKSTRYPLTGLGDINTFAIFAEHDRSILSPNGRLGVIVETGIATQDTYKSFFQDIVKNRNLVSLFDFENRKKIFPDVQGNMKFCLLTISSKPITDSSLGSQLQDIQQIYDIDRIYILSPEDLVTINPNTITLPTLNKKLDVNLILKFHKFVPILVNENTGQNEWGINFGSMFHMTNDSGLFETLEDLLKIGKLTKNTFIVDNNSWLPLYEAKLTSQYNHRHATFDGIPVNERFKIHAGTRSPSPIDLQDSNWVSIPRYWVKRQYVIDYLQGRWEFDWLIGFRNAISAIADARSTSFLILPKYGVGNSLPIIFPTASPLLICCLIANFNTFVLDYVVRQKASGGNLNFYIVKQLPILLPCSFSSKTIHYVIPRVVELTYNSDDIKPFADTIWSVADNSLKSVLADQYIQNAMNSSTTPNNSSQFTLETDSSFPYLPFTWNEFRRINLLTDLDALYAHLYGLHRDEFAYILDTFPIVRRKDEARFGEFRTKHLCLEAYDRIAASPEYEELIPVERERSKHSVLGTPLPVAPRTALVVKPTPQSVPEPAPVEVQSAPKEEEIVMAPEPEAPMLVDFGVYRCEPCNKMVMGYDRPNHNRDFHAGKEPPYKKIR